MKETLIALFRSADKNDKCTGKASNIFLISELY
jgi:hypothetical protein